MLCCCKSGIFWRFYVKYKTRKHYFDRRQCRGKSLRSIIFDGKRPRGIHAKRQILIYPATYNDYTENSPFVSVKENGSDYLLTAGKMQDYIDLYARNEEDKMNPYFAPYIAEDVSNQPDTLILTCEFDPLRDEGEAYGERLKEAGNHVEIHRIKDALHGYFALGIKQLHVQERFHLY